MHNPGYKEGVPESAIASLEECVRKALNNATYEFHLGMAYLAGGRPARAMQVLNQSLQHHPNPADAAKAQEALNQISKATN